MKGDGVALLHDDGRVEMIKKATRVHLGEGRTEPIWQYQVKRSIWNAVDAWLNVAGLSRNSRRMFQNASIVRSRNDPVFVDLEMKGHERITGYVCAEKPTTSV